MGTWLTISTITFSVVAQVSVSQTSVDGGLAYASWECASIATYSESYSDSAEQLFETGYSILHHVLSGMIDGELGEDSMEDFPVGIVWRLSGGPSVDFQLGALWTHFQNDAYELTWPDNEYSSFDQKEASQMSAADREFENRNCQFLVRN